MAQRVVDFNKIDKSGFWVVNKDDTAALSLMWKLCKSARAGSMIPVTSSEFAAMKESMINIFPNDIESRIFDIEKKLNKLLEKDDKCRI
ncbi:MAG: hypothetical protein H8D45_28520 [Bacteroidetes bacterium]|nr:hypothetical protein [Bacteroidota bacterium]